MNNKLNMLVSLMLLGFADIAVCGQPPAAPSIYANGPVSVQLQDTGISAPEKSAYALIESVMEIAEGLINTNHPNDCLAAVGSYAFNVFADGAIGNPKTNEIKIVPLGSGTDSLILRADIRALNVSRGQQLRIEQVGGGILSDTPLTNFLSTVTFNSKGTLMTSVSNVDVLGLNGLANTYRSKTIKDLYLGLEPGTQHIYDWGLQALSKLDFPIESYWQRSESTRENDGFSGHTVFAKDRLTGSSTCRIVIESFGMNNQIIFQQNGTLTISADQPNAPVPAFDAF